MNISPLVAVVPVVLAVALIIIVVRRNITERRPGEPVDIAGAIPAFVVLMVAVVFIGGMASSISPYTWDEDSGELTIKEDVGTGSQKWDPLGTDVKSLILNDNVTSVADGAFDTLTGLEYISISDSVESITASAFGVILKDCLDRTITEPESGEYVGTGDGTLFLCDPAIFTYDNAGRISGLTEDMAEAVSIVIPSEHDGRMISETSYHAFYQNTTISTVLFHPEIHDFTFGQGTFQECTALSSIQLPEGQTIIKNNLFQGCTSLEEVVLPETVTTISNSSFNTSGITRIHFGANIQSIGSYVFSNCTDIQTVSFDGEFSATLDTRWANSWTFYDSDGTTVLDKTVASNLAGYTFQGTASALVKVAPGQLTLTPDQIQQVHLHDQELQTMLDQPSIDPLPFQPSLQTQEQEPVSA